MKILFSSHALVQLRERNLTKTLVIAALNNPDRVRQQSDGRIQAIKRLKKSRKTYLLIVIHEVSNSRYEVITAFVTSKIKKYL